MRSLPGIAFLLTIVLPAGAYPADLYVSTTGTDMPDCSDDLDPCLTIQYTVDVAVDGDTIHVAAGTYVENVSITKDLAIDGAGLDVTIVDGGGLDRVVDVTRGTVTLSGVTITNGDTDSDGGGIRNLGQLTVTDVKVTLNRSANFGGGISNQEGGSLTLENCEVVENHADFDGGGIRLQDDGAVMITDCIVARNTAGVSGGGIRVFDSVSVVTLTNSLVTDNVADDRGGGIHNLGGDVTISDTTLSGNFSGGSGGGIFNDEGTLTLLRSTVSGNTSATSRPGLYNHLGLMTLVNSTVSGHSGYGIFNDGLAILTLANSTVTGNSFTGVWNSSGSASIQMGNSIIAQNGSGGCGGIVSVVVSSGYNLESGDTCGLAASGDLINTDPLLGPLADNGGPTFTHALLTGSPAIDAGNPSGCTDDAGTPILTDQRSFPRPEGTACDIGAFEACVDDTTPPDQGNVIRAFRIDLDVFLEFTAAPATVWSVSRDSDKRAIGTTEVARDLRTPAFTDLGAIAAGAGERLFYYVKGLSPCSLTSGP